MSQFKGWQTFAVTPPDNEPLLVYILGGVEGSGQAYWIADCYWSAEHNVLVEAEEAIVSIDPTGERRALCWRLRREMPPRGKIQEGLGLPIVRCEEAGMAYFRRSMRESVNRSIERGLSRE